MLNDSWFYLYLLLTQTQPFTVKQNKSQQRDERNRNRSFLNWSVSGYKQFRAWRKRRSASTVAEDRAKNDFFLSLPLPPPFFLCSYSKQTWQEVEAFTEGDCSPWTLPHACTRAPCPWPFPLLLQSTFHSVNHLLLHGSLFFSLNKIGTHQLCVRLFLNAHPRNTDLSLPLHFSVRSWHLSTGLAPKHCLPNLLLFQQFSNVLFYRISLT